MRINRTIRFRRTVCSSSTKRHQHASNSTNIKQNIIALVRGWWVRSSLYDTISDDIKQNATPSALLLRSNHVMQIVFSSFPVVKTVPITFLLGISHLHHWRSRDSFADSICTTRKKMASGKAILHSKYRLHLHIRHKMH